MDEREQPITPYQSLIGAVELFRDTKGDGGCFMEVLSTVTYNANLANMFHQQGQLDDGRFEEIMSGLRSVVDGLPPLQTTKALEEAFGKLEGIIFDDSAR